MLPIFEYVKFSVRSRLRGFDIPDKPHFDRESTEYFCEKLSNSHVYLEYGAGGSTVEAARQGKQFVTVESDAIFLACVREKIGIAPTGNLIYANIGLTGPWGIPLFKDPTATRVKKWSRYPEAPWRFLPNNPDLVLVDGRFRALCALTVAQRLKGHSFELLFDDYFERRSHFCHIEKFLDLQGFKGRMAIFGPKKFNETELREAKNHFATDFN